MFEAILLRRYTVPGFVSNDAAALIRLLVRQPLSLANVFDMFTALLELAKLKPWLQPCTIFSPARAEQMHRLSSSASMTHCLAN